MFIFAVIGAMDRLLKEKIEKKTKSKKFKT
jgi:hypothetical protein